jgi:hypothetical protein
MVMASAADEEDWYVDALVLNSTPLLEPDDDWA